MTLTFDLLILKVVSESNFRVTWATSVLILVFLGLSVLDLGSMYTRQTDRQTDKGQTDVRQHHCLIPPPRRRGIISGDITLAAPRQCHRASKVKGSVLYVGPRKKIKVIRKLYFTRLSSRPRCGRIFAKFGTDVDVISNNNFVALCSRISILQGVEFPFSNRRVTSLL